MPNRSPQQQRLLALLSFAAVIGSVMVASNVFSTRSGVSRCVVVQELHYDFRTPSGVRLSSIFDRSPGPHLTQEQVRLYRAHELTRKPLRCGGNRSYIPSVGGWWLHMQVVSADSCFESHCDGHGYRTKLVSGCGCTMKQCTSGGDYSNGCVSGITTECQCCGSDTC